MPNSSFTDFTGNWEHVGTRVIANAAEMPHLQDQGEGLVGVVGEAKELNMRQDVLRAELNQTTKDLNAVMARGRDLATRLRANVRGHFGNRSERLIEFGMRPLRRRQRQEEPVVPPVQPNPPTVE
jgi:hypothetical protein